MSLSLSIDSFNTVDNSDYDVINVDNNLLSIACTNARSIVEKIESVITLFDECSLHVAMITEAWLTKKHCPPRVMADLVLGSNIDFIRRDRGTRGGGVCICYNPTRIRLTKFAAYNNSNTELVCATGNCALTKKKIAFVALYLPPSLSREQLGNAIGSLLDCIDKLKIKFPDCLIFIGGDFNNKDMSPLKTTFPEFEPIEAGATRRGAALDEIYTNISSTCKEKAILRPLSKIDGTLSDHCTIAATFKLPKQKRGIQTEFKFRPITSKGVEQFGTELLAVDWKIIEHGSPSVAADILNGILQDIFKKMLP